MSNIALQFMERKYASKHYLNFHRDIVQICTMMSFHGSRDWLAEYILTINRNTPPLKIYIANSKELFKAI